MQLKKLMASLGVILCFCTTSSTAAYAEATVPYVDSGISLMYGGTRNLMFGARTANTI